MEGRRYFKRSEILKGKKAFEEVFDKKNNRNVIHSGCLLLRYAYSEHFQGVRVAFIVPKRLLPKATDRNRVKRRMREAYRLNHRDYLKFQNQLSEEQGIALCIMLKKSANLSFDKIKQDIKGLLAEVNRHLT